MDWNDLRLLPRMVMETVIGSWAGAVPSSRPLEDTVRKVRMPPSVHFVSGDGSGLLRVASRALRQGDPDGNERAPRSMTAGTIRAASVSIIVGFGSSNLR